ncbi:Fe-Mn family superoxide dismutase [Methylohalomonas lacus]|uniref:Superoxide dismutase n=1 Tax=Methylohalomonas lacus TaxID=398773 RepID=A0AAE3HLV4_9GAMM|nr:Fe-Mn family superoxide dismutase [Methylohalomonas lacus]MCS3903511.1 Fe-Mn family superoxide dismutase [Methylohalomonas lacus]
MEHKLPELPYAKDALAPHISAETLEYHYGKHHQTYVDTLNKMLPDSEFKEASLEDIIKQAPAGKLFNQAAQVWNHTFYWNSMSPKGGKDPSGDLGKAIDDAFGSADELRKQFNEKAVGNFGSGWTWLVVNKSGKLEVVNTDDAGNPLQDDLKPILTCDVWEHAYYIDYRNARPKYLEAFWQLVNWDFAARNFGG